MNQLDFTLVTTCRNEIRSFEQWKQNVIDQTRKPSEIVIVDAFSDDGTAEKLYDWARLDNRVKIFQEKGAAAHGRNFAISNAHYEIILSTDMGVRLSADWCEELISPFEVNPSVEVVVGNTCIDLHSIKSAVARAENYFENGGEPKLGPGHIPGNRSIAYTKKVWSKLNGLPEDLTFYADDSVFGRQMVQEKLTFAYAPKAMTLWARPQKFKEFFREQFVYGRGDGEAFIKTPRLFRIFKMHKGVIKNVTLLHGIIQLFKVPFRRGLFRAFKSGDIKAAICLFPLMVGKGYNYAKGYIIGFSEGELKCHSCRSRLSRDSKGYSIY
jgi:cellulose synthase/poly-beta-1,6-N-acetylglucosamine synthase-like glycosyltransferase